MCTVSYLPLSTGIVLTSNRDEHTNRPIAFAPHVEELGELKLTYPKDPKSGGSWIALKSNGDAAVLLNGAFEKHEKQANYRMSRGLIFLEVIKSPAPLRCFEALDLSEIENFTLIIFCRSKLYECRWDGSQKHLLAKDEKVAHLWSSATLYNETVRNERAQWFADWLKNETDIHPPQIIEFHRSAGSGDTENNLVMKRKDGISTFSITSIQITGSVSRLSHFDLKNDAVYHQQLTKKTVAFFWEKRLLTLRMIMIRTLHWEYWPMHVFYAPMYFYWVYLSFKARSLFFFSAANPLRKHAGFALEKKSEVYAHIPPLHYPKTVLCPAEITATELKMKIDTQGLQFPLIAKPDMGERGVKVAQINTLVDLVTYSRKSKTDFLVQEFIDYPLEAGIFYYRIPGELTGTISGIVGKELLTVTGDGISTITRLLKKEGRFLLQLSSLERMYGKELDTILAKNEQKLLVPYGNHCRGAKFIDVSFKITEQLTKVVDSLCKQLPEFYFGRLDIKFNSWEDLYEGKNFSVIECNGAASEPAHIYDPTHSIFYAWREIIHHWNVLYKISTINATRLQLNLMGTAEGLKMLSKHSAYLKKINAI
ncbi:NRDE family protein [Pedobacter sp. Du54]|uniref:NRDE family protein n=1 Tax=Pedobacter anseongensis TaxID=3133439 RepID=UPI0030B1BD51